MLTSSGQTGIYLFTGAIRSITLNPGTYDITAYGAQGGSANIFGVGGLGAEMEGEINFGTAVNLTILVGGKGIDSVYGDYYGGGGGGGGSFVVNGTKPLLVAGGGGGGGFYNNGDPGLTGPSGSNGAGGGGTGGYGGGSIENSGYTGGGGYGGGGGGGYYGSGAGIGGIGGSSFVAGGAGGFGGDGNNPGGYGGGGGGSQPFYPAGRSGGGGGGYSGGGGGGFGNGAGGGGSFIDASTIAVLAEVSGVASPDGSPNGEIIITAVPVTEPSTLGLLTIGVFGRTLLRWRQGKYRAGANGHRRFSFD
ncbi:MAG TPA: hypothetical protein VMA35_01855 [Candidatus Sulfopaludibacter sp.]|nr:hypothetical protein [Candidatus Sulfopaludibacter sp.]